MLDLIYDRTADDVAEALRLTQKAFAGTLTDEEKTVWLAGMKGAYDAIDMNRVAAAVSTLSGLLNAAGYKNEVSAQNFVEGEDSTDEKYSVYLSNVQTLRDAIAVRASTPELPAADAKLDYIGANNIEKILADLDELIGWMTYSRKYCGTFAAGQTILPRKG